ncbi:MAG: hypothetical protein AB7E55_27630 [Pigmentiphaga sp.]
MSKQDKTDLVEALKRLVKIAHGDTGQSRLVANFLLAWWNAGSCGGFDLTDLWGVDRAIANDMIAVIVLIASRHDYPDVYGLRTDFERMVAEWRPELLKH